MSDQDLPFQLIAWIKREQLKDLNHQEYMVRKNQKDDLLYLDMIKTIFKFKLSTKEHIMIVNMLRSKKEGKNWSIGQRSVITGIYYKKTA